MAKIIQVTPELLESTAGKIEGLAGDYKTQYTLMLEYADFLRKSAKGYRDTQDNVVAEARKLVN